MLNSMLIAESAANMNVILMFGLIVFAGTAGARICQKFGIPQVIGCVTIGILLGRDLLGIIDHDVIEMLKPFTMFSLGMIGFMIGGELRAGIFKKYGKQFISILLWQGIGATVLVAIGTGVLSWFITGNIRFSIAMGLVFGAIASATAPAATVNVLWEYKTRGPLTAAILAIVALDDGLALLLFKVCSTASQGIMGAAGDSVAGAARHLAFEIFGAIFLGLAAGAIMHFILKIIRSEEKILAFSIASILLVVGLSMLAHFEPILPAMTAGVAITNLAKRRSKQVFELVGRFTGPVYTAFFVLAGAHMEFKALNEMLVILILAFAILRAAGKVFGSWIGAKRTHAPEAVQKYLGICLLPQAGVSIGLAILAAEEFGKINSEYGQTIIMVVMTATFIMEIAGPMLVKIGVKKAGEVGLNITEDDLIKTYKVSDVMEAEPDIIPHGMPLGEILETFSKTQSIYYPVVDNESKIVGKITVAGIKEMFANRDVAGWLLACDVAETFSDKTSGSTPLEDAIEHMKKYDIENMSVVADDGTDRLVGVLDRQKTLRKISAEILRRRELADGMSITL